jgi:anti-sigma factor RsiW
MNDFADVRRCDEEAARLLPWYVAGRLEPADIVRVTRHLERCATCRDELAGERAVRALLKSESTVEYAPQPGLARMLARIDELEREAPAFTAAPAAPVSPASDPVRRYGAMRWLAAAALVQAVALGVLGTLLYRHSVDTAMAPRYTTLSADAPPAAAGEHIRAVFSPDVTLGALKDLLAESALTIVRGPSDAGAYTLAFREAHPVSGRLDKTVAALRAKPLVKFAEPAVNDEVIVR